MSEPLNATLRRLKVERDEADRRYNEALTALDQTLPPHTALAEPQARIDEHQLETLNEAWNILPAVPATGGLQGKLTGLIWRTIGPYLQRQLTFNSVLVDHINRNVEAQRAAHRQDLEAVAAFRAHVEALSAFHSRLMGFFQQFTGYVDTKDRDTAGGALVLNAALSDLAEGQAKYRESLAAREHRYEARTSALSAAVMQMQEEFRVSLGVANKAIATLKRHVTDTRVEAMGTAAAEAATPRPGAEAHEESAFAPSLDAYKYVGFEDQFRGSQAAIRERQESYLPYFSHLREGAGASRASGEVLDVGCGRGEFIDLLNAQGIPARGIDLNHEMAELCRARGLDVTEADAVEFLSAQPDESLGGIFAAQVVEHLEPAYLLRFLDLAFLKLQPGARLVLETLNPACWTAFFESYIRDITHRWPLHPETLQYLVRASGFTRAEIEFRSPVPAQDRLQPLPVPDGANDMLRDMADTFNANAEKLNARMFTFMDYAVVAEKSRATG
jgi:SAM-dependent methyltransferase